MSHVIAHATAPHLPLALDVASVVLVVGAVVLLVVAYDLLRQRWPGGE